MLYQVIGRPRITPTSVGALFSCATLDNASTYWGALMLHLPGCPCRSACRALRDGGWSRRGVALLHLTPSCPSLPPPPPCLVSIDSACPHYEGESIPSASVSSSSCIIWMLISCRIASIVGVFRKPG